MLEELKARLRDRIHPEKAAFFPTFFKAGPGEYAEGDKFLGITVPDQRMVAREFVDLPLSEIETLLASQWHEERLTALLIMVMQYKRGDQKIKKTIYDDYLQHTDRVNNWDLVDTSARDIVGAHIYEHQELLPVLDSLAESDWLWDRRIAMIATYYFLMQGEPDVTVRLAEKLLHDEHDLMHKAVGWMLREMGKRVDQSLLISFLDSHATEMPRTTLRYAIEHLSPETRQHYLKLR
ncbi:DNA alkylation repair protein [Candidatus Saccharibacteria bacterium]|nr:DNA alkylation repair protein [Candidatus Saccharibacteria bacterium]